MLKIGDFSRLAHLTVKALRFYAPPFSGVSCLTKKPAAD